MIQSGFQSTIMPSRRKKVLFYRDYRGFTGGHLKVWDYFNHILTSETHEPLIYFSENTIWDSSNPWAGGDSKWLAKDWEPESADLLFLGGMDWEVVPEDLSVPIVNLVQGLRHAKEGDPRRKFLHRRAFRICVSTEVQEAIASTGIVNGPIMTIPNGVDLPKLDIGDISRFKRTEVLIAGMKNPGFAKQLSYKLSELGYNSLLLLEKIERDDFLNQLRAARIAILLPLETEGFFLPALEAMAMGCLVICPDCIGNRSFCLDGINCFSPAYSIDEVLLAACHLLNLETHKAILMLKQALATVEKHRFNNERNSFQKVLCQYSYN